jgi:hypothetical protein
MYMHPHPDEGPLVRSGAGTTRCGAGNLPLVNGRKWPCAGGHERPLRRCGTRRIRVCRPAASERTDGLLWVATSPTASRVRRRKAALESELPGTGRSPGGAPDPDVTFSAPRWPPKTDRSRGFRRVAQNLAATVRCFSVLTGCEMAPACGPAWLRPSKWCKFFAARRDA